MRYLSARGLIERGNERDGEMDEPESKGAIGLRESLENDICYKL